MSTVISITDAAKAHAYSLLSKAEEDVIGLRLGVKTRGCSGNAYDIDYAKEEKPGDEIVKLDDMTLYIDASAVLMLFGTEMDYEEDKFQSGFVFRNPNETGRCGCGESFHV